jgi:hypothetical protein
MPHTESIPNMTERGNESPEALQKLSRTILRAAFPVFRKGEIEADFYSYIGLTHTIRRKGATWIVRISDHCRQAPGPVLEAILMILAYKVMHRSTPPIYKRTYELFRRNAAVVEAVRQRRLLRGRKHIAADAGKYHSLQDIYEELNRSYFNNQIEIERIGWGIRNSRVRLGHYDPIHNTITLSPVLDSPTVPKFVLGYILYHEMLHSVFETDSSQGIKRHHPPEFRRTERAYPDFARAKKFLGDFCGRRSEIWYKARFLWKDCDL